MRRMWLGREIVVVGLPALGSTIRLISHLLGDSSAKRSGKNYYLIMNEIKEILNFLVENWVPANLSVHFVRITSHGFPNALNFS